MSYSEAPLTSVFILKKIDWRRSDSDRHLSHATNVVEWAFGWLKSHWCCLPASLKASLQNVGSVITACVMFYNTCEDNRHSATEEMLKQTKRKQAEFTKHSAFTSCCRMATILLINMKHCHLPRDLGSICMVPSGTSGPSGPSWCSISFQSQCKSEGWASL